MHPTSSRSPRGLDRTRTGYRRPRTSRTLLTALACLATLGCLAGFVIAERDGSPVGPTALSHSTAWPAGTPTSEAASAPASRPRLGAVSWPAEGESAAFIGGRSVTDGPAATRQGPLPPAGRLIS